MLLMSKVLAKTPTFITDHVILAVINRANNYSQKKKKKKTTEGHVITARGFHTAVGARWRP